MITIIKDGNKIKCSQNTYDTMYRRMGYEIFEEKPIVKKIEKTEEIKEVHKEKVEEIIEEKPIKETIKKTRNVKNVKGRNKKGE